MFLHDANPTPTGRGRLVIMPASVLRLESLRERDARLLAARTAGAPSVTWERLEVVDPRARARRVFFDDPSADPERDLIVMPWAANLVVTTGKVLIQQRLFALAGAAAASAIGVGSVATGATVGDTQLNAGGGGSAYLQAFDSAATLAGTTITATSTIGTANGNFTWNEFGFFNGTTNGTNAMYNRIAPVGPFTKTPSVAIAVTLQSTQN